jgi:hypothetical protein
MSLSLFASVEIKDTTAVPALKEKIEDQSQQLVLLTKI